MGSGASKKRSSGKDDPRELTELPPKILESSTAKEVGDEIDFDPSQFISPGQEILFTGHVWKLNYGADRESESQWLKRRMWLTSSGGLFYYSSQYCESLGCSISGLSVKVPEGQTLKRFLLEVHSESEAELNVMPTVLGTDSAKERDAWVKAVLAVQDTETNDGGGVLDPLEPLLGHGMHSHRFRLREKACHGQEDLVDCDKHSETSAYSLQGRHSLRSRGSHASERRNSATFADGVAVAHKSSAVRVRASLKASGKEPHDDRKAVGHKASLGPSVFRRAPLPRRHNSQANFSLKTNTVLVLDWDDTIFPTTFIRKDCGLDWRHSIDMQVVAGNSRDELKKRLEKLSDRVDTFMTLACSLACVVIVTLAQSPWVANSAMNFMPRLHSLIQQRSIKVIYARDKISEAAKRAYAKKTFKTSEEESQFWMRAKAMAMQQEFESLHTTSKISWKNIISFGDSDFERVALLTNADEYVKKHSEGGHVVESGLTSEMICKDGHVKRLRAKTVKMLDEPSCEEMIAQITLLTTWLPYIVNKDEGIDVELADSTDDQHLCDLNKAITGETAEELKWLTLAGLDG